MTHRMSRKICLYRPPLRAGLSILEVLFAIGIVLVGLLGIASIIPLAARQASDSYLITNAGLLAENGYRQLLARRAHQPRPGQPWLVSSGADPVGVTGWLVSPNVATLEGQAQASSPGSIGFGFCLDPLYVAANRDRPSEMPSGAYAPIRFPAYPDNYNPLSPPSSPANDWPPQPRMLRTSYPNPNAPVLPMTYQQAQLNFGFADDFSNPTDSNDSTLNRIRGFFTNTQTVPIPTKAAARQELSWFATISPYESNSPQMSAYHTLSIVVVNRRSMTPDFSNERLCWAVPAEPIGAGELPYTGGAGFSVDLWASADTEPGMKVGSWIMLSRWIQYGPIRKPVFKWFQLVGIDAEPELFPSGVDNPNPVPGSVPGATWRRRVRLMGPDWLFSNSAPTTATILSDAVTVHERVIPFHD
jgi:Tfp pilus assembly protein PilV